MMNKKVLVLIGCLTVVATIGLFVSLKHDQLTIYPFEKNTEIRFNTSHEGQLKDFSTVETSVNSTCIKFKYTLSKSIQEPIVALYFYKPLGENPYFDFSRFNEIAITLNATKAKRIPIYLTIDYKNLHSKAKDFLSMPLVQVIDYKGAGEYKLNKKDFEIPSWWLRYHGLKKEVVGEVDFSKVNYVLVNSCQTLGAGIEDEISIHSLSFVNNNTLNYLIYGGLMALMVVGTIASYLFSKRKKILVPYKINELTLHPHGTKLERILHFIGSNYSNPDLTVTDIQEALGISTREIGSIIKDELGTNFKTYLNTLRLTEVKRLLQETDLPISDIAYKTGYNNISHFNRVFKKEYEVSPSEFREKKFKAG
jgi:AraC-like DNA-binding protein